MAITQELSHNDHVQLELNSLLNFYSLHRQSPCADCVAAVGWNNGSYDQQCIASKTYMVLTAPPKFHDDAHGTQLLLPAVRWTL